jgi:hypothetical protein
LMKSTFKEHPHSPLDRPLKYLMKFVVNSIQLYRFVIYYCAIRLPWTKFSSSLKKLPACMTLSNYTFITNWICPKWVNVLSHCKYWWFIPIVSPSDFNFIISVKIPQHCVFLPKEWHAGTLTPPAKFEFCDTSCYIHIFALLSV